MKMCIAHSRALSQSNNCVVVVLVAMAMLLLMLPSGSMCYRLETLDDLKDLLSRNEDRRSVADNSGRDSALQQQQQQKWNREFPLMINLLRSIDDWERLRLGDKDSSLDDSAPPSILPKSKRGRDTVSGAMPPMRELCRMMGYAYCPH